MIDGAVADFFRAKGIAGKRAENLKAVEARAESEAKEATAPNPDVTADGKKKRLRFVVLGDKGVGKTCAYFAFGYSSGYTNTLLTAMLLTAKNKVHTTRPTPPGGEEIEIALTAGYDDIPVTIHAIVRDNNN